MSDVSEADHDAYMDARESFIEFLEAHDVVHRVNDSIALDFRLYDNGVWFDTNIPSDEELRVIRRSSIHFGFLPHQAEGTRYVKDVAIHFPPTTDDVEEDLRQVLGLPDELVLFTGSRSLGGISAPDGLMTPHILLKDGERTTFDAIRDIVDRAPMILDTLYDGGDAVVLRKP